MSDIFVISGKLDVEGADKVNISLDNVTKKARQTGSELDKNISQGLNNSGNSATNFATRFGNFATNIGTRMQNIGSTISNAGKAFMPVSAGLTAIGTAGVAAFQNVNSGSAEVIRRTGAIGEKANELRGIYKDVAIGVSGSFQEVGATVGAVASRFNVSGDALKNLSTDFQKFSKITGIEGSQAVDSVGRALSLFNMDASESGRVMDLLTSTSQRTGANMGNLLSAIDSSGSIFKQMGFSIEESIGLMGQFESAGLDSGQMLAGLKKGAASFAKSGKDVKGGLDDLIKRLQDTKTSAQAESEA